MYFGCQCSSARFSCLLVERSTLFGIRSALIMKLIRSGFGPAEAGPYVLAFVSSVSFVSPPEAQESGTRPVELGFPQRASISLEGTPFADRVGPLKDPVLPRGQSAEDLRLECLRSGKPQIGFHGGQRVR